MAKAKEYNYKFDDLYPKQIFKNFTAMFQAITGEKPPTGSRNRVAVERELSKYIDFGKLSEIDTNASPWAYIVKEVYDTPRTLAENRGKSGKYADYLKPLLLVSCGFSGFDGKMYKLANQMGILGKYTIDMLENTAVWKSKNKIDKTEFNPWAINEDMLPGKQQYFRSLWGQIRNAIERSLDSLQKEGIIKWRYYHQLIPSVWIDIEESEKRRTKSKAELEIDKEKREELLKEIENDNNSVLKTETLERLNIYSKGWPCESIQCDAYKGVLHISGRDFIIEFPLRATAEQEAAICNLEDFMRQYTYKKCYKLNQLPSMEETPNAFKFFQDVNLRKTYKQLVQEMYPWLIECKVIWKELEYEIIGTTAQIDQYINLQTFDYEKCEESLSCEFLNYMDSHMGKIQFQPTFDTRSDLKRKSVGERIPANPLEQSKSACKLHDELKSYYKI